MAYTRKDKELLAKVQQDKKHFDKIYQLYVDDIYRFAFFMLQNQHDAEDITSQVFLDFYEKIDNFEWQGVSPKYWLIKSARFLIYNKYRLKTAEEFNENRSDLEVYEVSFVDRVIQKDLVDRVKCEIEKLKVEEREVVNLRIWEEMQFNEIAELQNKKENSVRKKFYRSIEKVKLNLEEQQKLRAVTLPVLFTAVFEVGNLNDYKNSKLRFDPNLGIENSANQFKENRITRFFRDSLDSFAYITAFKSSVIALCIGLVVIGYNLTYYNVVQIKEKTSKVHKDKNNKSYLSAEHELDENSIKVDEGLGMSEPLALSSQSQISNSDTPEQYTSDSTSADNVDIDEDQVQLENKKVPQSEMGREEETESRTESAVLLYEDQYLSFSYPVGWKINVYTSVQSPEPQYYLYSREEDNPSSPEYDPDDGGNILRLFFRRSQESCMQDIINYVSSYETAELTHIEPAQGPSYCKVIKDAHLPDSKVYAFSYNNYTTIEDNGQVMQGTYNLGGRVFYKPNDFGLTKEDVKDIYNTVVSSMQFKT